MCCSLHNATPLREGRPTAGGHRSKTAGEGDDNKVSLMHPLRQRPHWLDSFLAAREPFQNQGSPRHHRILIWAILSVAGVPGAPAPGDESPYDPGEVLKSVPWRLRSPASLRPVSTHHCRHMKSDQSPPEPWTGYLIPTHAEMLIFHIHCLWHGRCKFSHRYG